jgi:hypothetical protein
MGKQIYNKPIWILFKDFANELKEDQVFKAEDAVDWVRNNYPIPLAIEKDNCRRMRIIIIKR